MSRADAWQRTILHVELDAFQTSVHQHDDRSLRGEPVVVAGRSRQAAVICASHEARACGVDVQMPVAEALERCPTLTVLPPRPARYREVSRQAHTIFRRFTSPERIEAVRLEETYLDLTARTRHGTSTPDDVARRIKFAIQGEIGLTSSIGAATSKLVAKVAGGTRQPDGLVLVQPGTEADFMAPLPIGVMPGLGPKTAERLRSMGVRTVGELASSDTNRLLQALGTGAVILQRLAQGRDRSPVEGNRPAKTFSAETTFDAAVGDAAMLARTLRELIERICERLTGEGVSARTVAIKVKLADLRLLTRQVSRPSPTDNPDLLFGAAQSALNRLHLEGHPVRLLGVAISGLTHPQPDLQMTLFD